MMKIGAAEKIVRDALGSGYGVIPLGGDWHVGTVKNGKWVSPLSQSRSLDKAIAAAKAKINH